MKFKIVKSTFIEGLKKVQNIVTGKGSLQILQNVLLKAGDGKVEMITTDLDISIFASVPCEVEEAGQTTLPVKFLFNSIQRVSEGEVSVEVDGQDKAVIRAGSAKYRLTGMSSAEFPKLPEEGEEFSYNIDQAVMKEMLRKVAYAASQDDTRRTLKGVLFSFKEEKLTLVATDGRRLALIESDLEFPQDMEKEITLPSKTVVELQRSLSGEGSLKMKTQQSQVSFAFDGVKIYSKLIDDVYPNYKQVIPSKTAEQISVDRQLLLEALERASVMTVDGVNSTKLTFDSGKLTVASSAGDTGEVKDEVPIKYAGEKIEIVFNPAYLLDALKAIDDDEISVNLNNGHSPAVIKCGVPFLYVIMPLRTN